MPKKDGRGRKLKRITLSEEQVCAIIDGLLTLIEVAYETDDEREEELKWLHRLVRRLEKRVGLDKEGD